MKRVTDPAAFSAVVKAANLVVPPVKGHPAGDGIGRRVPMPASVTDADLASGDQRRWIGWTATVVGVDGVLVDDWTVSVIAGTAKDPDGNTIDPATIIKDAKVLSDAKSALAAAVVVAEAPGRGP